MGAVIYLNVRKVEGVCLIGAGRASALAEADFSIWRIIERDRPKPLEAKLRQCRFVRLLTTRDATPHEDGTYPENGLVFISGWTANNDQDSGMPADQIVSLVRSSDAYLQKNSQGWWPDAWVSIQHAEAQRWFLEAVRAGEKYKLRLGARLVRDSEEWAKREPRAGRARAFASQHPLFLHIDDVEFVRR